MQRCKFGVSGVMKQLGAGIEEVAESSETKTFPDCTLLRALLTSAFGRGDTAFIQNRAEGPHCAV